MSGTHPNIPTPDRTARNPLPFPGHPPTAAPATDSIRIAALALELAMLITVANFAEHRGGIMA